MQITLMIVFTLLGTVLATFLGALFSKFALKLPKVVLSFIQNFAVGGIIGLIFMELVPESIENFISTNNSTLLSTIYACLIIAVSGLFFFILHEILHKLTHHHEKDQDDDEVCEDHGHTIEAFDSSKNTLLASSIFLLAIAIHNIPEGLSFGVIFNSLNSDNIPLSGIIMAVVLFLHNLLIGFTMFQSFKKAGKATTFSIIISTLSAVPAFIFALIGFFIDYSLTDLASAIIFAISSGSLLYVLFIELLPQVFYEYKTKYSFIFLLLGFILTLILLSI